MADFLHYEKDYLLQKSPSASEIDGCAHELSRLIAQGSYVEALKSGDIQVVFHQRSSDQTLASYLEDVFTTLLAESASDQEKHTALCIGIASLQLIVQSNFTGPAHLVPQLVDLLPTLLCEGQTNEDLKKEAVDLIAQDTAGVYTLLKNPEYFALTKTVFGSFLDNIQTCCSANWWCIRYCKVFQIITDETSGVIYDLMILCVTKVENSSVLQNDPEMELLFNLELTQAFLLYSDIGSASTKLDVANNIVGFESKLAGGMGKRTKYQVDAKSQLLVTIEFNSKSILPGEAEGPKLMSIDLPKNCQLNDDTRLEHIKFMDEDKDKVPSLRPIEQAALLCKLDYLRRSSAHDLQLKEEANAFVNALLQNPKCWVIQYNALRMRSKLESNESRAVDRALQQFEELVACVKREEPSRFERLKLFYASGLPASWITRQEYGSLLVDMGCTKTALGLFEELELWEDVIDCYNRIGMRQRSSAIIKDLLDKNESPKLWCLLGDATDNLEHYHKAWELSKHRSSLSQKQLGDHFFGIKEYTTAIEHYTKSIEVNHLQIKVWHKLAYAALQIDNFVLACSGYKKCTILEPDVFEYWNNLAKSYVELDEMHKAWVCFNEAVRCKSDSWKIFENLMTVSSSLEYFNDALFAYTRLLTLKPRHINLLVISEIVDSLQVKPIEGGKKSQVKENFYKSLVTFLSQLCQTCPSESDLWYYYGETVSCNPTPTTESRDLACQHFRKALAACTRDGAWYKNHLQIKKALTKLLRLEEALNVAVEGLPPQTALVNVRSVKMLADNVIILAKKGLTDVATGEIVEPARGQLSDAEIVLQNIKSMITKLTEAAATK